MKVVFIILICVVFLVVLFISSGSEKSLIKTIIISDALFLEIMFYCISHLQFLVPSHNILGMIVSGKQW